MGNVLWAIRLNSSNEGMDRNMIRLNRAHKIFIAYGLMGFAIYLSWIQPGWDLRFGILLLAHIVLFLATVRIFWGRAFLLLPLSLFQTIIFSLGVFLLFNPTYRTEFKAIIELANDHCLNINRHGEIALPDNLKKASITRSVYTAELESENQIIFFPMASGKGWDVGGYLFARHRLSEQQMQNGVDIKLWEMYGLRSPVRLTIRWKLSDEWYIVGHST